MTTEPDREYAVRLDRDACDGIFACLVRDDRFAEADDGLATFAGESNDTDRVGDGTTVATFTDDRLADAQAAAAACPVGAIEVEVTDGE